MLARNKIALVLVGVGIGVASVWHTATSDAFVSWFLRAQIAKHVRAPTTFQEVKFDFLRGIELVGVEVLDPFDPAGPPLVAAERGKADFKIGAFGLGPRITGVEIDRPRLRLDRMPDGTLSIADVFSGGPSEGAAPRPFVVKLTNGEATYVDDKLIAGAPLALKEVTIDVRPESATAPDWGGATVTVTAVSDVLGAVRLDAVVGDAAKSATLTLDLASVRVDPGLPDRFVGELARKVAAMKPVGDISARVVVRAEEGKELASVAELTLRDASVRVTLPEAEGRDPPKSFDVTKLNGRLRYDAGRVEMTDLSFRALDADVRMQGTLDDAASAAPRIDANVTVTALPVTRELRDHAPSAARSILVAYDITGVVDAKASAQGALDAPTVRVEADLSKGHVRYDGYVRADGRRVGFPYAVEDAQGKVTYSPDGIRIEATARHGTAKIAVRGAITPGPDGRDVPDVTIVADDASLDDDLAVAFGDNADRNFLRWGPSGTAAHVVVHVFRDPKVGDERDVTEVVCDFDGRVNARPFLFPEPLSNVRGRLEILEPVIDGRRESLVRLTNFECVGDGFTAKVSGDVIHGEDVRVEAEIAEFSTGIRRGLLLSPNIPAGAKTAVRKLEPKGPMSAQVHVVGHADGSRADVVAMTLKGASFQGYGDVHMATRNVTGRSVIDGDVVTFEEIAGEFVMPPFAPRFTAAGKLAEINSDKPQPTIHLEAPEIPLGEPLRIALGPLAEGGAGRFWTDVRPVGTARAGVVLDLRPDADPTPFEATLTHIHGGLHPLGLELDNDEGTFHYDGRRAEIRGLESAIGAATLRIDEADYDVTTGQMTARVSAMRGLRFPEDLEGPLSADAVAAIVEKMPGRVLHATEARLAWEPTTRELSLTGTLSVRPRTRRALPDPGYAPEGSLEVENVVFHMPVAGATSFVGSAKADAFAIRAGLPVDRLTGPLEFTGALSTPAALDLRASGVAFRVHEYPFKQADVTLKLLPRGARVNVAKSKFMDGDFSGWVGPGPEGVAFQGEFHLTGADLETFQRWTGNTKRDVATGKIDARIAIRKPENGELMGTGALQARDGRLTPEPGVMQMLAHAFTLGVGGTDLSGGSMEFDIRGDWIVGKFELREPDGSVRFTGEGKIGFDGRIDLLVDPRPEVGLPFLNFISKFLFRPVGFGLRQRITGTLRNPKMGWAVLTPEGGTRPEPQPADDERPRTRDPW